MNHTLMIKIVGDHFKLLVVIVRKDLSRRVLKACKKAGSEGGTVLQGRGIGHHNEGSIFGVKIEPEKAIVLSLVPNEKVDPVIAKVRAAVRLDKPGTGIAFVVNSRNICGIAHLLPKNSNSNE